MTYEVELKFPLADPEEVTLQLLARGATAARSSTNTTFTSAIPHAIFSRREAFRIRRVDDDVFITYKGPVLDRRRRHGTRSRSPSADPRRTSTGCASFWRFLGFQPVRPVEKTRALFHLTLDGRDLELAVDSIDVLGTYLEIEALAEENDRNAARDCILGLAEKLGLAEPGTAVLPA